MKEFIEKLIERLEELPTKAITRYKGGAFGDYEGTDYFIDKYKTKDIINELVEEYKGGWIPCSERLPEEPFGCLVTVMDCEPMTQTDFENILPYHVGYDGETWNDADGNVIPFEVIAWQPLPAPYKEGVTENE